MKSFLCAAAFALCIATSTGCSNNSGNVELPAPELTIQDYERMATEEAGELEQTIKKNEQ